MAVVGSYSAIVNVAVDATGPNDGKLRLYLDGVKVNTLEAPNLDVTISSGQRGLGTDGAQIGNITARTASINVNGNSYRPNGPYGGSIGNVETRATNLSPDNVGASLTADGNIGNVMVASGDANVDARRNIGNVTVSSGNALVVGRDNVGTLQVTGNARVWAHELTGELTVTGDLDRGLSSPTPSWYGLHVDGDLSTNVTVGGDVSNLDILGALSSTVDVEGAIRTASINGDMTGTLDAASASPSGPRSIRIGGNASGTIKTADPKLTLSVGRDLSGTVEIGSSSTSQSSSASVSVYGNINDATVTRYEPDSIALSTTTGSIDATVSGGTLTLEAANNALGSYDVYSVSSFTAGLDSEGDPTPAGGSIQADRIIADQDIGSVTASDAIQVAGDIRSNNGNVQTVEAFGGGLSAAGIAAPAGHIDYILAQDDVSAAIEAQDAVGQVLSSYGSILGSVTSQGEIGTVDAFVDVRARVEADDDLNPWYDYGGINYPNPVIARHGDITGDLRSKSGSIQDILAGKDITGTLDAATSIDRITAGADKSGNITGNLTAGTSITDVTARDVGVLPTFSDPGPNDAPTEDRASEDLSTHERLPWPAPPVLSRIMNSASGNISGRLAAGPGSNVQNVTAYGTLGEITAGNDITTVRTQEGVTSDLEAGNDLSDVEIGGDSSGSFRAQGDLLLRRVAGGLSGILSSSYGDVVLYAWGTVDAEATGKNVTLAVFKENKNLDGTIKAQGIAIAYAPWGAVGANEVRAAGNVLILGDSVSAGTVESTGGKVTVLGQDQVTVNDLKSRDTARVTSFEGSVGGSYVSAGAGAELAAKGGFNGLVRTASGILLLTKDDVTGAELTSDYGNVVVLTLGTVNVGQINAKTGARVEAVGPVTANVTATDGNVMIFAGQSFSGTVDSTAGTVGLTALGDVSGSVTSGGDANVTASGGQLLATVTSNSGAARVSGYAGIAAAVTGYTLVDATSWSDITARIESTNGSAQVFAAGNITADVVAKTDATVTAWDDITGQILVGASGGTTSATATVEVHGRLSGNVQSSGSVTIDSYGPMENMGVTATGGDVHITSTGEVNLEQVVAGGNVSIVGWKKVIIPNIKAGENGQSSSGNVLVRSYDNAQLTITTTRNVTIDAARELQANTTTSGGKIEVSALEDIKTSSFTASAGSIDLFTGGNVETVTLKAGDTTGGGSTHQIDMVALGTITGTAQAEGAVDVRAYNAINMTATSTGAAVTVAGTDLQGTYTGKTGVSASAEGPATGTYTSAEGPVTLGASGEVAGVEVQAGTTASVFSGEQLEGTVTANNGDLSASALGTMKITATAPQGDISAGAFGGELSSELTAERGSITALAGGPISAPITSGTYPQSGPASIKVLAQGPISGQVTAGAGGVDLTTMDSLTGGVSAQGDSTILVGGSLDSAVSVEGSVDVNVFGPAGGSVTTTNNSPGGARDATFYGGDSVYTTVTAQGNASVTGAGSVSGSVTAQTGRASVSAGATAWGDVTGGTDASVWALGPVSSSVTAQNGNASATSWGDVRGDINGSVDAFAWADGSVTGGVTASSGDAGVFATGTVAGNTSAGGDAGVTAYGLVSGDTSATGSAAVQTFANLEADVTGGADAFGWAFGDASTTVTAGTGDAGVSAFGALTATLTAGNDAVAWAGGAATIQGVTAGNDAFISGQAVDAAGSTVVGNVQAQQNVSILALGGLSATGISAAAGNVGVTAMGDAQVQATANLGDVSVFTGANLTASQLTDKKRGRESFSGHMSWAQEKGSGLFDLVRLFCYAFLCQDCQTGQRKRTTD
ncbi:MAG: beta strand repeat-containing protein [Pirellulales bacterium]